MENLRFYMVSENYINYLRKFDTRIQISKEGNGSQPRKYIGVILKINDFNYFAPLSSYKEHLHDIHDERHDFIKITEDNPKNKYQKYAVLYLNNIIPVPECALINFDFDKDVADTNYSKLLKREYLICKKKLNIIQKSAKIVYANRKNLPHSKLAKRCCDFSLLEEKCLDYKSAIETNENIK